MILPIIIPELEHVPNITYANGSNPSPNVTSGGVNSAFTISRQKLFHNPMINVSDLFANPKLSVDNLPEYLQNIWFIIKILLFGLLGLFALANVLVILIAIWHLFHEHVILFFTENYEWIKDEEEAERKAQESKAKPYEEIELQPLKRHRKRKQKPDNEQRNTQNTQIKLFCFVNPDKSRNRQQKKRNRLINREIEAELAMRQQKEDEEFDMIERMIAQANGFQELGSNMEYHDDSDLESATGVTNINKRPAVVLVDVPVDVHIESAPTGPVAGSSKQPFDFGARSISYEISTVKSSAVYFDRTSRKRQNHVRLIPERDVDEIETIP